MKPFLVILGLSAKPERYAYLAFQLAREHGLNVVGVHPEAEAVRLALALEESVVFPSLAAVGEFMLKTGGMVHTLSVYVHEQTALALVADMRALMPKRVILNPGADSSAVCQAVQTTGLTVTKACTLVLMRTGQY